MTEQEPIEPYVLNESQNIHKETPETQDFSTQDEGSDGGVQDNNEGRTQDEGTEDEDEIVRSLFYVADDKYKNFFMNVSDYGGERDSDGYPEDGKTSESGRSTPADEIPADKTSATIEDIALKVYSVLYSKKCGDKMDIIKTFYDSSAVFQDPLVITEGHDNIYLQFELLSSLVTDLSTQFSAVTVSPRLFLAKQLVVIDAVVTYHFLFFQRLSLRNTTMFVFDDKQKIVSHEDVWSVSDLIKNIPIVGWVYGNIGRKVSAFATNQLYSLCRSTVLSLGENA